MKIRLASRVVFLLILSVIILPSAVTAASAVEAGASVSGRFVLRLEKGTTRTIVFSAVRSVDGKVSGETVFQDEVVGQPNPASESSSETPRPFFLKAEFDCLVINGNKAMMSGAVTESSLEQYVGRRIVIVAQENGGPEDSSTRDKLTWGVYRNNKKQWLPGDSERPEEASGQGSWLATDSEREDDPGALSTKDEVVGCQTVPLSAFAFVDAGQVRGKVQLKQQ